MQETKDLKAKLEDERKKLLETEEQSRRQKAEGPPDRPRPAQARQRRSTRSQQAAAWRRRIEFETWGKIKPEQRAAAEKQQIKLLFDKITAAIGRSRQGAAASTSCRRAAARAAEHRARSTSNSSAADQPAERAVRQRQGRHQRRRRSRSSTSSTRPAVEDQRCEPVVGAGYRRSATGGLRERRASSRRPRRPSPHCHAP